VLLLKLLEPSAMRELMLILMRMMLPVRLGLLRKLQHLRRPSC
jgi:hypothetical protein